MTSENRSIALASAPKAEDRAPLNRSLVLSRGGPLARTWGPWRDLPEDVIDWHTAWRRLQRWTAAGIWSRIVAELRDMAPDAGWDAHLLDSSVIRAHAHAAGVRHTLGEQALGRSRGGFSTKLHLRATAEGRPVALHLTGVQRHDLLDVGPLFEQGALRSGKRGRPHWKPDAVIAGKAYSAAWLLDVLRSKGIVPIILSRADRPRTPDFDRAAYRRWNLVERLVGKLKQLSPVATFYDKLDAHYLTFVQIASVMVWLRSFGDKTWPEDSLRKAPVIERGSLSSASGAAARATADATSGRSTRF